MWRKLSVLVTVYKIPFANIRRLSVIRPNHKGWYTAESLTKEGKMWIACGMSLRTSDESRHIYLSFPVDMEYAQELIVSLSVDVYGPAEDFKMVGGGWYFRAISIKGPSLYIYSNGRGTFRILNPPYVSIAELTANLSARISRYSRVFGQTYKYQHDLTLNENIERILKC